MIRIRFTGSTLKEPTEFRFQKKGTVKISGKEALFKKIVNTGTVCLVRHLKEFDQKRKAGYLELEAKLKESGEPQISLSDPESRQIMLRKDTLIAFYTKKKRSFQSVGLKMLSLTMF